MIWEKLLSLNKYGDITPRPRLKEDETRLSFDMDYDRVVFSSAFRSLQDKTQVIPLSKTGFVHTRLIHSIKVSDRPEYIIDERRNCTASESSDRDRKSVV